MDVVNANAIDCSSDFLLYRCIRTSNNATFQAAKQN